MAMVAFLVKADGISISLAPPTADALAQLGVTTVRYSEIRMSYVWYSRAGLSTQLPPAERQRGRSEPTRACERCDQSCNRRYDCRGRRTNYAATHLAGDLGGRRSSSASGARNGQRRHEELGYS